MASGVAAIWRHRHILALLLRRDLAVKYRQSILGYLWSLIEPLTVAATYWFVFGLLFASERTQRDDLPYLLYLSSGLFAWIWVNGVLGEATTALTAQARLITTIQVPREVFPIGRVAGKFAEYVAALPVLVIVALAYRGRFSGYLLLIPAAVALQAVLLIGVALLLASLNVMVRDVEKIVRLVQRVLFYALPIVYPLSLVTSAEEIPGWLKVTYLANPLVGIIELHHSAWTGVLPPSTMVLTSTVGAVVMLLGGWWVFRSLEPAVLKEL